MLLYKSFAASGLLLGFGAIISTTISYIAFSYPSKTGKVPYNSSYAKSIGSFS